MTIVLHCLEIVQALRSLVLLGLETTCSPYVLCRDGAQNGSEDINTMWHADYRSHQRSARVSGTQWVLH